MHYNDEIFNRFIKFGKVSTEKERIKIAEIIKDWQYVPVENSNIEKNIWTQSIIMLQTKT